MILPDFLKFKPFIGLRQKMGADELGYFNFFNPAQQLSHQEREELSQGLFVSIESITFLDDHTLAYKDSRVIVNTLEQDRPQFHLADCEQVRAIFGQVRAGTSVPPSDSCPCQVCTQCLQRLRYKGYDELRPRHRHYSQRVQEQFELRQFFFEYPAYPLVADTRHPLAPRGQQALPTAE